MENKEFTDEQLQEIVARGCEGFPISAFTSEGSADVVIGLIAQLVLEYRRNRAMVASVKAEWWIP